MLGEYCGNLVAPAWFASASEHNHAEFASALEHNRAGLEKKIMDKIADLETKIMDKIADLETKITDNHADLEIKIMEKLAVVDSKISNGTALDDSDNLIPPQVNPIEPPPRACPTTLRAMRSLEIGPDLRSIEDYYALPHTGNLNRLRRMYGVIVIL